MGHPTIDNETAFSVTPYFAADEDGRPLFVPLVQATYTILGGRTLELADKQEPASLTGELWGEDAATSSYKIEPAFAFTKPATDVALVGSAEAPRHAVPEMMVSLRVGGLHKALRVVGDRVWVRTMGAISSTRPLPFDKMPLSYDRAFGGWDRSSVARGGTSPQTPQASIDPSAHAFDPRNPVGKGFRAPGSEFEEGIALPNIEDPADPLTHYGQLVAPAGVGFTSPNWQPRAALAGTYDEAWTKERMPLLPKDFDRRFFNAASAGLMANGYLKGNEPVVVEGASPLGRLSFNLPGGLPLSCQVTLVGRRDAAVPLNLDTVIIDTEKDRVLMLYRGFTQLRDGPHDVKTIAVREGAAVQARGAQPAWMR